MDHQLSVSVCNVTNITDLHFFIAKSLGFVYATTASNFSLGTCSCSPVRAWHVKFASTCNTINFYIKTTYHMRVQFQGSICGLKIQGPLYQKKR